MFLKKKVLACGLMIFVLAVIFNSGLAIAQTQGVDRIITVTAVGDEEFIDFYGNEWKDRIRELIEKASRAFERFGIAFEVIEFRKWQSEEYGYPRLSSGNLILPWPFIGEEIDHYLLIRIGRYCELALLFELKEEVKPENADIVIAFTGQPDLGFMTGKVDDILGRYVLIVDADATIPWFGKKYGQALKLIRTQKDPKKKKQNLQQLEAWFGFYTEFLPERLINKRYDMTHLLIHELGHIFGAEHTEEESVMKVPSTTTNQFDKKNIEIIINNKWRTFN